QCSPSAREAFFGLQNESKAEEAIGDEIVSFDLPYSAGGANARGANARAGRSPGRVWLILARDSALMLAIVERAMVANRAVLTRERHRGVEIRRSSDAARESATFIGDFLMLGRRDRLIRVVDLLASGQGLKDAPRFVTASKFKEPAAMKSFNWVGEETHEMMATI